MYKQNDNAVSQNISWKGSEIGVFMAKQRIALHLVPLVMVPPSIVNLGILLPLHLLSHGTISVDPNTPSDSTGNSPRPMWRAF
jgi:hypothetical protein